MAGFRAARTAERSGKPLEAVTPVAESSPAPPEVPAPSTEGPAPAASEPAKPPTANAETRIKELLADRHRDRTRIAELEAQLQPRPPQQPQTIPAASSPAPAQETATFPDFDAWLKQAGNEEKSYEAYIDARTDFRYEQHDRARQAKDAQTAEQRQLQEKQTAYRQQTETFVAEHPDFWEKVAPVLAIPVNTPTAQALVEAIQASGPALLYGLAENRAVLDRLVSLPERLALWELGKFEAGLSKAVPPPPKVVTSAPAPPTTLGHKPGQPASDTEAAVRGDDVRAFRQARLAERTANLR